MTLPGGALGWDVNGRSRGRRARFRLARVVQLDGRTLPRREEQIRRLPGRFIIDHVGKFLEPVPPSHPAFKSLLKLVDTGRCWVKLSAAYEVSKSGPPKYDDVGALAKALVKHAPERMLWASKLAASDRAQGRHARRREPARPAARMGAGRERAPQDPRRQSRRALRFSAEA